MSRVIAMIVAALVGVAAFVATFELTRGVRHVAANSRDDQDPGLIP